MPIMPDTALRSCPSWCAMPPGHAPNTVDRDGSTYVVHRTHIPDAGHAVELEQTDVHRADGSVEAGTPEVVVDGRADTLTAVRRLAAGLLLAAELGATA